MKQQWLFSENLSLGPKSNYSDYKAYISSPEWKNKRTRAFKLLGRSCQKCGSTKNLEVHHLHYETLFNESATDVNIVCARCHPSADYQRATTKGFFTHLRNKYGEWADHYNTEEEHEKFIKYIHKDSYD